MSFAKFVVDLRDRYGVEAAGARHEIFFIHQRSGWLGPGLRAFLAALRDAALCLGLRKSVAAPAAVIAVSSRAGFHGLEALRPFIADLELRDIAYSLIVHPRLRASVAAASPGRPLSPAWLHALQAFHVPFPHPDRRAFVVRCCLFRLRLWQGAWSRVLGGEQRGSLILHNDFELFCVAALRAGAGRWLGICVQHGLPTDEFFPTLAQRHIVWGDSSRLAYIAQGTPPDAIHFGPERRLVTRAGHTAPSEVCLVSQTHTPVFGRSLAKDFLQLAERLADAATGPDAFAILLHPEEVRLGHPFAGTRLAGWCRLPPHRELRAGAKASSIVVGFCSTALIEAARQGHLVIGMNWPVEASQAALSVGRPANLADNAEQLCGMLERLLADPAEWARMLRIQDEWLARSFAHGEDWLP
jgi:hypothetical protein